MNRKQQVSTLIAILCLICFILITILVVTNHTTSFDQQIYEFVIQFRNSNRDWFFTHFTHIGDTIPIIIISITILFLLKNKKDKMLFFSSLAFTAGSNKLLKHVIKRARPPLERRLITQKGYSYPSGHSMVSICIYGILLYLVITRIKNKGLKVGLSILLTIMILLIGISRIYVGVHYPSDVIGGFLLSVVILLLNITSMNSYWKGE